MAKGLGVEQRRQRVTRELARLRERQGGGRVGVRNLTVGAGCLHRSSAHSFAAP